jgi:hypothetical protein
MDLNRLLNTGDPRTPQEMPQALRAAQATTLGITGAASVLPSRSSSNAASLPPRQQLMTSGLQPQAPTQQQQTPSTAIATTTPAGQVTPARRRYVPLSLAQQAILREMRRVPGFDPNARRETVYTAMLQHKAANPVDWQDKDMQSAAGVSAKMANRVRRHFVPDWPEATAIKTHVANLNGFPHAGTPKEKAAALIRLNTAQDLNWRPLDIAKAAGASWSEETTIVTMAMSATPRAQTIRNDVRQHGQWGNQKKQNYREVLARNDARVALGEQTWSKDDMRLAAGITKNDAYEVDAMHRRDGTAAGQIRAAMAGDLSFTSAATAAKKLRAILTRNAQRVCDGHPPWADADMCKAVGLTSSSGAKVIRQWRAAQGG